MHLTQSPLGWSLTLLALVLALAPTSYAKANMNTFFTLRGKRYFPERNDKNGCKDLVPDLESSYAEAAKLIDAASSALADLRKPRSTDDDDAAQLWDVRARTIEAIFGISIDVKAGGAFKNTKDRFDETRFTEVVKIFDAMKYGMEFDNSGVPSRKPALYCGTDAWVYLRPEDNDPNRAGKKISDKKWSSGNQKYPDGVHHFNGNYIWFKDESTKVTGGHKICSKKGTVADTIAKASIITWCDLKSLKLPRTLPVGDIADGEALDAKSILSISKIWVHELSHFYGSHSSGFDTGLGDETAVDEDGNVIKPEKGSYGVRFVWNLAKKDPELATHNADGYANFALAMYLGDYDWSENGKAKKIVKKAKTP